MVRPVKEKHGPPRDDAGDLLTSSHGVVDWSRVENQLADLARVRQDQVEAGVILIEDLRACDLTGNESRVLNLLAAGWNIGEAAGIMGVNRKTAQRAVFSIRTKIWACLH